MKSQMRSQYSYADTQVYASACKQSCIHTQARTCSSVSLSHNYVHIHTMHTDARNELARVRWDWPGFGAAHPTLVEEIEGRVKGVALGGWHALALVE